MKRIIFRADDLGYSEGVNLGIAKTAAEGLIRNIGVMVNMEPAAQGIALLQGLNVSLGVHGNISAGYPLSDPLLIPSLVNEDGTFKSSKDYAKTAADVVLDEVVLEVEAQYQQFIKLTGKQPSYMDGHAVASVNFFRGIELVANRHHITYSPFPASESDPITIGHTSVLMHAGSTLECGPADTLQHIVEQMKEEECHMIVYHPGFLDAYLLEHSSLTTHRAYETQMLCDPNCIAYVAAQQITCAVYDEV